MRPTWWWWAAAAGRAAAQKPLTKWQLRRQKQKALKVKQGFAPSWTRSEASNTYSNDALTRDMTWNEERHCEYAAPSAERFHRRDSFVVALAYDTPDPLPTLAVLNSTAHHASTLPEFAVVTTRPRRLLGLLRHPRVARDLPPGFNSTTSLFASACLARFPLCAAGRGVAACASLWHGYVSPAAARVADL